MSDPIHLAFTSRPRATRYMLLALAPKPRLRPGFGLPETTASWRGLVPSVAAGRLTGTGTEAVHPIILHASTMRLMMAMLTQPRFPIPIWRILQVRNRIVQHSAARCSDSLDLTASVAGMRRVSNGVELDVKVQVE